MKKIAMIGLRGSGKTCFTTAMTMAMSSGIRLEDGSVFNLSFADLQQMTPLMNAYMGMTNDRNWPPSSEKKVSYDFNSSLSLRRVLPFTLLDYPGGYLTDPNHMDEMLQEFNECASIIVLVGADMLRQFIHGNYGLYPYFSMLQQFTQHVISEFDKEGSVFPPTIIAITKSDEFANEDEVNHAYSFLREKFATIFQAGTNIVSGLTRIQLGNNLKNNGSKIEGELILKPNFGNLSIPILFSLYASAYTNRENVSVKKGDKSIALSKAQGDLMKAQNENIFIRIRDRISGKRRSLEDRVKELSHIVQGSNEQLSNLSKVIDSIEPTVINGAELYYNGVLIN
jgi:hypothetical protein